MRIDFPARLNFITGPNAFGKTNILEAISLLATGKSFRGATDQDMIRRSTQEGYFVSGRFKRGGISFDLQIGCESVRGKMQRRIKMNGKALSGRQELIGKLVAVIMSPGDIMIVEGGPSLRRRFLDMVLSYQQPGYLNNLILYNRTLRQRNALLKKIKLKQARPEDVSVWDNSFVGQANRLIQDRLQFVQNFNPIFQNALLQISGQQDPLQLRLDLSHAREAVDFRESLQAVFKRDCAMGYTTVGPHRQNLLFEHEGQDIVHFGSQGQKRSLVLSLRVAQFNFLRDALQLPPILLIDDVIRELDARRRSAFVKLLGECGQAIFTTPDMDGLSLPETTAPAEICIHQLVAPGKIESGNAIESG